MAPVRRDFREAVHLHIYDCFLETGRAPAAAGIAAALGAEEADVNGALGELAAAHAIVLAPGARSIRMAHPFSAEATSFPVISGRISYWANCAWDVLGIAAVLERDTQAFAECPDCGEPIDLSVRRGNVEGDAIIHFLVPPGRFWDDVGYS